MLPVLALSVASCGGPGDGNVATIQTSDGEVNISEAQFKRFLNATRAQNERVEVAELSPLDPPDFERCVAEKQKAAAEQKSQRKPSAEQLKKECEEAYDTAAQSALNQLVNFNWIEEEVERRGLTIRQAALARERQTLIDSNFQGEENYKEFLDQYGFTQADVDLTLAYQLGSTMITQDATEDLPAEPTEDELRREFRLQYDQFVQPETRDLRVIKAKSEADAKAAREAIESGASWSETARKYSTDPLTKDQGGSVIGTTAADQPVSFAGTVFKADAGELLGPIKDPLGWYVVKVQKITPKVEPKFEDVQAQLAQTITQTRQQEALQRAGQVFQKRWTSATTCADEFDELVACGGTGEQAGTAVVQPSPPLQLPKYAKQKPVDPATQQLDPQQQPAG